MSLFTVMTTPTQIHLGAQGVVTLLNEGPATVYIESNSSVNPANAFPLRPLASMTWQAGNELWAVTSSGQARLNTNVSGYLSDPNRSSTQRLIYQFNGSFTVSESFEVGSYETLLIRYLAQPTVTVGQSHWTFVWSDDDGNAILQEDIYTWATVGIASLDVPVRGSHCEIYMVPGNAGGPPYGITIPSLKVYGSTRELPLRANAYIPVNVDGTSTLTASRNTVGINNWVYADTIAIPSWGNHLRISYFHTGTITVAGTLIVGDLWESSLIYGIMTLPTGTTDLITADFIVPTSRPLSITCSAPTGALEPILTMVWSD